MLLPGFCSEKTVIYFAGNFFNFVDFFIARKPGAVLPCLMLDATLGPTLITA